MEERRKDRKQYIALFKKYCEVPWESEMTPSEQDKFDAIEKKYSAQDLIFFRKLGYAEIEAESKQHANWLAQSQKKQNWLSWNIKSLNKSVSIYI